MRRAEWLDQPTRRAETVVELTDGQSFAIAGLLDNISQNDAAAIPILQKLPIIGAFFKSKSRRAEQTELMVLSREAFLGAITGVPQSVEEARTHARRYRDLDPGLDG